MLFRILRYVSFWLPEASFCIVGSQMVAIILSNAKFYPCRGIHYWQVTLYKQKIGQPQAQVGGINTALASSSLFAYSVADLPNDVKNELVPCPTISTSIYNTPSIPINLDYVYKKGLYR